MTQYYKHEIYKKVSTQRTKALWIYLIFILGVYLIESGVILGWYLTLPFKSPQIKTLKWIHYPITGIFVIVSFIYLGIPYKRVNKFYRLCIQLETGIRESFEGKFFEYDASLTAKDNVDCKSLVFIEWNRFKNKSFERRVLVFYEMPFPEIPEGAMVKYVTQGNVLIEYEILEQPENEIQQDCCGQEDKQ